MVGDEYERERWRGFNGSTSTDAVLTGGKETKYIKPMIVKADDVTITTA